MNNRPKRKGNSQAKGNPLTHSVESKSSATSVLATSVNQLDAIVKLGDYTILNGEPVSLGSVLTAVDTISRRQRAALTALGSMERS